MIKFFRKIRQQLLFENKLSKYLLYAIGEIVLVVIGILIALAINDAYNTSKNEEKVRAILNQIQQEIIANVEDCNRIFGYYITKDSRAQNIYNDLVSEETNAKEINFTQGVTNLSVNSSGYKRLIDNLEILPEKYKILLPQLNIVYVEEFEDVNAANAYLNTKAKHSTFDRLYTDPEHTDHLRNNFSTDEAKKYLLDDPFLKNRTVDYMRAYQNVVKETTKFRIAATDLYIQIDALLGNPKSKLPKILVHKASEEFVTPFLGVYTHFSGTKIISSTILKFENDQFFHFFSGGKRNLYWHKDNYFFTRNAYIIRLFKNDKGQSFFELTNGILGQTLIKK